MKQNRLRRLHMGCGEPLCCEGRKLERKRPDDRKLRAIARPEKTGGRRR